MTVPVPPPTAPVRPPGLATKFALVAAGFMMMMGGAALAPALPDIKAEFHDIPYASVLTGLILSTHALAIVLFSPLAGWVTDRFGRKPALLTGLGLFTIAGSSGFVLPDLPTILAGRFVMGLGIALIMTSSSALIGDLWTGDARQRLISYQQASTMAVGILLTLGGGALATMHWRTTFLIHLLGILVFFPVLLFVPKLPAPGATEEPATAAGRLGSWLLLPTLAMFLTQILGYIVPTQLPGLIQHDFDTTPFVAGACLTTMSLVMAPTALLFPRIKKLTSSMNLVAVAFCACATAFGVVALASEIWVIVVAMLLYGFGMGLMGPVVANWIIGTAADEVRGRATGMLATSSSIGQFLSPITTQPLIDVIGLYQAFAVLAVALLVAGLGYFLLGRGQVPGGQATACRHRAAVTSRTGAAPHTTTGETALSWSRSRIAMGLGCH